MNELLFALLLTYQSHPTPNDFVRVDFTTAQDCMDSVGNLITAEEERPVAPHRHGQMGFLRG